MGFGSFDFICEQAALPLCALVGSKNGIEPICYARNVELANTLIFQAGTSSSPQRANVNSNRLHSYCRVDYDHNHDISRPIQVHRCRSEGNHNLLLPLHGAYGHLPHSRLWRCPTGVRCVSILCCCTMWPHHCHMLVSPGQWIRWIPICRRRNSSFPMGTSPADCMTDKSFSVCRH